MGLGLGLGFGGDVGDVIVPLITGVTAPVEYEFANIDLDGGGQMIDITYANPYVLTTANQVPLYIGDASPFANRILQFQYQGSGATTEALLRNRVVTGGVTELSLDYNHTVKYASARQKLGVKYDAVAGSYAAYYNGIKTVEVTSGVAYSENTGMKLCFGKITGLTSLNVDGTINNGEYYGSNVTDSKMREVTRNTQIITGNTLDASRNGILVIGESNAKGPSTITGVELSFTNETRVKNLGLNGTLGDAVDIYMDATGNLFNSNIFQVTTAGVAYAPLIADAKAATDTWYTVGAAEGATSIGNEWVLRDANGLMNNLMYGACTRLLMGAQVGTMRAIILDIGINDAIEGTTESVFKAGVTANIAELRAVHGSNLRLVIVGMQAWDADTGTELSVTETAWNNTNSWLEDLAGTIPNAAFSDISDLPGRTGDKAHYRFSDYGTIASRSAALI